MAFDFPTPRVVKWFRSLLRLGERVGALEKRVFSGALVGRGLFLVDRSGKIRGSFALSDDDSPSLAMNGPNGTVRFGCFLQEDGSPRVVVYDADGELDPKPIAGGQEGKTDWDGGHNPALN